MREIEVNGITEEEIFKDTPEINEIKVNRELIAKHMLYIRPGDQSIIEYVSKEFPELLL